MHYVLQYKSPVGFAFFYSFIKKFGRNFIGLVQNYQVAFKKNLIKKILSLGENSTQLDLSRTSILQS